ncbi:ABC transporter ATP-binding protein [Dactylosporangium sp. CA-092794]|uniref:ABC transporter ATP-binding protein n=1 Tax=Dactylosporangium sp. CA-092794 TaxID=3239929 RepID=UPI003D8F7DBE
MNRPAAGEPLVIQDLSVGYGRDSHALREVSMTISPEGVTALLGNNGAGKTTLLRALSGTLGLHRGGIRSGRITWGPHRLDRSGPTAIVRRGLLQVPEGRHVFGRLTVGENLRVGGMAHHRQRRRELRARVYELFPVLEHKADLHAAYLSGGEQQMLAIGRALMADPAILLLDEPSLGLAPLVIADIADRLRDIRAAGTAIVVVEQNSQFALSLADRAYVLDVGRVALAGRVGVEVTVDDVRDLYLGQRRDAGSRRNEPAR